HRSRLSRLRGGTSIVRPFTRPGADGARASPQGKPPLRPLAPPTRTAGRLRTPVAYGHRGAAAPGAGRQSARLRARRRAAPLRPVAAILACASRRADRLATDAGDRVACVRGGDA